MRRAIPVLAACALLAAILFVAGNFAGGTA
jgi:hypothetical protein